MNRYFTIVDTATLDGLLPESIKDRMGYNEDYTLRDVVHVSKELEDGNWAISIQICPLIYLKGKNVQSAITEDDLELAKSMYGEENLITEEEYRQLNFLHKPETEF